MNSTISILKPDESWLKFRNIWACTSLIVLFSQICLFQLITDASIYAKVWMIFIFSIVFLIIGISGLKKTKSWCITYNPHTREFTCRLGISYFELILDVNLNDSIQSAGNYWVLNSGKKKVLKKAFPNLKNQINSMS